MEDDPHAGEYRSLGGSLVVLAFGNDAVVGDFVWSFHWEGGCR
jgi:hypothetical protein